MMFQDLYTMFSMHPHNDQKDHSTLQQEMWGNCVSLIQPEHDIQQDHVPEPTWLSKMKNHKTDSGHNPVDPETPLIYHGK
jgi:isochorismate hydrolase